MLKEIMKKLKLIDITEEIYGTVEDYEAQQLNNVGKRKKVKNKIKVEVDGVEYDSISQANKELDGDINWHANNQIKGITNRFKIKFK